MSGFFADG